jgi:hypothetical protein
MAEKIEGLDLQPIEEVKMPKEVSGPKLTSTEGDELTKAQNTLGISTEDLDRMIDAEDLDLLPAEPEKVTKLETGGFEQQAVAAISPIVDKDF